MTKSERNQWATPCRYNIAYVPVLGAKKLWRVNGLSLSRAVGIMASDIFLQGHAYIALSRVRSMDGVVLVG